MALTVSPVVYGQLNGRREALRVKVVTLDCRSVYTRLLLITFVRAFLNCSRTCWRQATGFLLTCHPQHAAVCLITTNKSKGLGDRRDTWVLHFNPRTWTAQLSMVRRVIMSLKRPDSRLGLSRFQHSLHAFEKRLHFVMQRGWCVFSRLTSHAVREVSVAKKNHVKKKKLETLLKNRNILKTSSFKTIKIFLLWFLL